jgi:NAD(P)-dependent dehydrogenase (short-subunit alcohol dehydrogenase family)
MAVVLITGASTGIGMAAAVAMGRAGHDVQATMRNPARSPELASIAANEKLPISIRAMDVDDDSSVKNTIAQINALRGRIDALVNNAGIGTMGPVEELPLNDFRQVFETNYFGALRCIQAVLPGMRERKNGCIINVTSVAGRVAAAPQAAYASSKWALEALSEILAQEVKPFNIRVAIVEPGIISTPIFTKMREVPTDTRYPHEKRLMSLFSSSLQHPVPPLLVGEKIRDIIESETWQLRHPVGPDAVPFIEWRKAMSDEEWIKMQSVEDDELWYSRIQKDFGLDARPRARKSGAS